MKVRYDDEDRPMGAVCPNKDCKRHLMGSPLFYGLRVLCKSCDTELEWV